MQRPFENAKALLNFLEADEPERYVFRGQTRSYDGPMLSSGARDRFTPFDSLTGRSKWAGITTFQSGLKQEVKARQPIPDMRGDVVVDGKSIWDLPEAAYQKGFGEFFNQPHIQRMRDLGNSLREGAIPGICELIGNSLGSLLCQQYGFTSTALDVTTDPSVALFFANHQAPFYTLVTDSPHLGVVYRWPRARAMIAQDLLLPLESSNFLSIITSFRNFINDSADVDVVKDALLQFTSVTGAGERYISKMGGMEKRIIDIIAKGEQRNFDALRFPPGAFDRSRMGCQHAALLWPDFEVVKPLRQGQDSNDRAALIGDLLKTHQGEFFQFRHTANAILPDQLDKFVLWPSIRPPTDSPTPHSRVELQHELFEFEDLYLEMMLRFFSTCSPLNILMWTTEQQTPKGYGLAVGVVDLGYLLESSDARVMAERLKTLETYTPIPTLRYIPKEYDEERTQYLEAQGYKVMRFWNNQVMNDIEGVIKEIMFALDADE